MLAQLFQISRVGLLIKSLEFHWFLSEAHSCYIATPQKVQRVFMRQPGCQNRLIGTPQQFIDYYLKTDFFRLLKSRLFVTFAKS